MARSSRSSEVGFFSFSFLDILACTVGVLVFMIAIIVVHTLGMSVPPPLRKELSGLSLDLSKLNKELENKRGEADQKRRASETVERSEKLKQDLSLRKELEAFIAELAARRERLETEEPEEQDELKRLRALVPFDFTIKKREIKLVTPVQKASKKRALYFECVEDKVNPFFGRYVRKYYVTKAVGESSVVVRRRPGETLEQTSEKSSDWRAEIEGMDPKMEYVAFIVRPSGFDIFMQLRKLLSERGIEVAWEPLETGAINMAIEGSKDRGRFLLQ